MEGDVDEVLGRGELGAVDVRDGDCELVLLGDGERDGVVDLVEWHLLDREPVCVS